MTSNNRKDRGQDQLTKTNFQSSTWLGTSILLNSWLRTRLPIVSNFGDGDCGEGETHTRGREISSRRDAWVCIFSHATIAIAKIRDYSQSSLEPEHYPPFSLPSRAAPTDGEGVRAKRRLKFQTTGLRVQFVLKLGVNPKKINWNYWGFFSLIHTSLESISWHFVPSRAACIAFVNKAVNKDNMMAPTRIQTTPKRRPRKVFGVLSPYLITKENAIYEVIASKWKVKFTTIY